MPSRKAYLQYECTVLRAQLIPTSERCKSLVPTISIGVPTSMMDRHGETTVYFFAEPTRITSRCLRDRTLETTVLLCGAGSLYNVESCHFSTESLQLHPGLRRETEYTVRAPPLYAPTLPAITLTAEMEQLKKITETTDTEIEQVASINSANGGRTDLNTMIRLRPPQTLTPRKPEWLVLSLLSMGTVTSVLILYQLARKILTTV
jgi:hypothetical protein